MGCGGRKAQRGKGKSKGKAKGKENGKGKKEVNGTYIDFLFHNCHTLIHKGEGEEVIGRGGGHGRDSETE